MNCQTVPATMHTLYSNNGEPLLLYGEDECRLVFLWPLPGISRHPIAFGRWCRQNVGRFRGTRLMLQHPLCARTLRWAQWLGVTFEGNAVVV